MRIAKLVHNISDDSHTGVLPPGCSPVQTLKGCASRMVASSAGAARPCTCDRPAIKAHVWLPPCARCLDANSLRDRLFAGDALAKARRGSWKDRPMALWRGYTRYRENGYTTPRAG